MRTTHSLRGLELARTESGHHFSLHFAGYADTVLVPVVRGKLRAEHQVMKARCG